MLVVLHWPGCCIASVHALETMACFGCSLLVISSIPMPFPCIPLLGLLLHPSQPDPDGLAGNDNRGLVPHVNPLDNLCRVRQRRVSCWGGVGQQAACQPRAERVLQFRTIKEQFTLSGSILSGPLVFPPQSDSLENKMMKHLCTMSERASLDPTQSFLIHFNVAKQCHHIA